MSPRRTTVVNRDAFEPDDGVAVGRCCSCDADGVRLPNLMMVEKRGPASADGKGWGCFVCGLASNGATAAVCERCIPPDWQPGQPRPGGELRLVCTGYVTEAGRMPIEELLEPWEHDRAKHLAYDAPDLSGGHADGDWFDDDGETDAEHAARLRAEGDPSYQPFVCGGCGVFVEEPDHPPVLAWPHDAQDKPLPDPNRPGDIQMLRLCDRCLAVMVRAARLSPSVSNVAAAPQPGTCPICICEDPDRSGCPCCHVAPCQVTDRSAPLLFAPRRSRGGNA